MFDRLKSVSLFIKSRAAYDRGDYAEAIYSYNMFIKIRKNKPKYLAYAATLYLLNDQYEKSESMFVDLINNIENAENVRINRENIYILNYSKMYLSGLNNSPEKKYYFDILKKIKVRSSLRRLLPVSDEYIGP